MQAQAALRRRVNINISRSVFNTPFLRLLECTARYLVFYGGAGSGKSYFIAQRYVYKLLKSPMMNLLVVRQTGDTNRDSTFALFKQVIHRWGLSPQFSVHESDMRITCRLNGNQVIFKGLDDTEKLKSITFARGELTDIWIEEASEVAEQAFNQLDVRLRGGKAAKQIVLSFNPVDVLHWLKKFVDDAKPNKVCMHSTYRDNKFLDDEYKKLLESYRDTDPYYYAVYCMGEWGVLGATVFNAKNVSERIRELRDAKPKRRGYFEYTMTGEQIDKRIIKPDEPKGAKGIRWVDAEDGYIELYEEPKRGYPYVIGGDTAGEGSDWFTGQAIDNTDGKQVARLRQRFDEDLYAHQMYCMGMWYNEALIALETNFSTYPVKELQRLSYPRQYLRQEEDQITHKLEARYGVRTDRLTRPNIIAGLIEIVRESVGKINDTVTLNEMLTFVRNKKGRPEAQEGAHDDCIMGLGIAYYAREQQRFTVMDEPKPVKKKLIDDLRKGKTIKVIY